MVKSIPGLVSGRKRRPSPIVEQRLLYALPNGLKAGEVHTRVELVVIEDLLQRWSVEEVHLLRHGSEGRHDKKGSRRSRGAAARVETTLLIVFL